jgi:hypothetical protein
VIAAFREHPTRDAVMKNLLPVRCLGVIPVLTLHLLGQTLPLEPLELRQASAKVNVSTVPDVVPSISANGSAGKPRSTNASEGAAPRHYGSVMSFGGGIRIAGSPTNPPALEANRSLVDNAVSLNLPRLGGRVLHTCCCGPASEALFPAVRPTVRSRRSPIRGPHPWSSARPSER